MTIPGPMRLLFCCESYLPERGGVQEVMRQIAERMAAAGHRVTVATRHVPERTFDTLNGVEVRGFDITGNLVRGMSGEVERYRDFVLGFGADAILIKAAQQWSFDALWPVLDRIAARKVFIPCGFSGLHEPAFARYFAQMPDVLRKLDHLIFYAERYRDIDFCLAHGLNRFSVLPNGASEAEFDRPPDPQFRARLGIAPDAFVFLTVGSPIAMKGFAPVAEAFAALDTGGRPATLIMNGRWPHLPSPGPQPGSPLAAPSARLAKAASIADRLRLTIRQEGLSGLVSLARRERQRRDAARAIRRSIERANAQPAKRVLCTDLRRPDMVEAFMAADLFILASVVEYSPLVLFEAVAAGTPFLSVPVGNAEEIARWTGGGVISPAETDAHGYTRADPRVLAQDMHRCMNDPDLLARLGRIGRESWRRQFTWAAIAPRYEAILRGSPSGTEAMAEIAAATR
ncbi:MAG: glycosyltransferase family 4 protein [Xanthobacteraceae bacterium]